MTAEEIIQQVNSINHPNTGVRALVDKDSCIMDEENSRNFKHDGKCPEYYMCNRATYMLKCLQTRKPEQLGRWVIDTYSKAMED